MLRLDVDALQYVREVLEANGFGWIESSKRDEILASRVAVGLSPTDSEFDDSLHSHKFRRLMYWLTDRRGEGPFTTDFLIKMTGWSREKLGSSLAILLRHRLAQNVDDAWSLVPEITATSFSPTLHWYVTDKFNRELHWRATPSVHLQDTAYNDFDIIVVRGPNIGVVECKLTDPDHVEDSDLEAFWERHKFLRPDFSILPVDSDKPMTTLADRMNTLVLKKFGWEGQPYTPTRLDAPGNAFSFIEFVYVSNTDAGGKDGLLRGLQLCLRDRHARRLQNAATLVVEEAFRALIAAGVPESTNESAEDSRLRAQLLQTTLQVRNDLRKHDSAPFEPGEIWESPSRFGELLGLLDNGVIFGWGVSSYVVTPQARRILPEMREQDLAKME